MISYAKKEETEKSLFPLWLVKSTLSELSNTDYIEFQDFVNQVINIDRNGTTSNKSAEDIVNELLPIVELDRKKGEDHGKDI